MLIFDISYCTTQHNTTQHNTTILTKDEIYELAKKLKPQLNQEQHNNDYLINIWDNLNL